MRPGEALHHPHNNIHKKEIIQCMLESSPSDKPLHKP